MVMAAAEQEHCENSGFRRAFMTCGVESSGASTVEGFGAVAMSKAVEEVLSAWRDAERVLESLPPIGRDHEDVALAVGRMRALYRSLTDGSDATYAAIEASRTSVEATRALLAQIRGHAPGCTE